MIDIMESDYFLYAMARGEKKWTIIRRHGLRNIMLPALTLQFASISEIFGGSVLVEQVFSYPGLVFAGNLIANILYGVVDPRIRRGQGIG